VPECDGIDDTDTDADPAVCSLGFDDLAFHQKNSSVARWGQQSMEGSHDKLLGLTDAAFGMLGALLAVVVDAAAAVVVVVVVVVNHLLDAR